MTSYLIWFLSSMFATGLFTLGMRAPRRALLPTSLMAGIGYTVYMLVTNLAHSEPAAIFLATVFVAVGSEILATLMKMPATIFMFPGIVPLVPGIGIYRTMLYLFQRKYEQFGDQGAACIVVLGVMAVAIALTNEVARRVHGVMRRHPGGEVTAFQVRHLPQLRPAIKADAVDVASIYRSCVGDAMCAWNDRYPSFDEIVRDLAEANLFVLTLGEEIVACASAVTRRELDGAGAWGEIGDTTAEIARVAVAKGHRGRGYGVVIVSEVERILKERGFDAVHLAVSRVNLPARKTYDVCGYTQIGTAMLFEGEYDLMEKRLTGEEKEQG